MVQSFCGACPRRFASLSPREMQSISGPERFIESPGLGPRNLADFRGDLVPEITFVISRGAAKRSSGDRQKLSLVPRGRLERPAYCLGGSRSVLLSYRGNQDSLWSIAYSL